MRLINASSSGRINSRAVIWKLLPDLARVSFVLWVGDMSQDARGGGGRKRIRFAYLPLVSPSPQYGFFNTSHVHLDGTENREKRDWVYFGAVSSGFSAAHSDSSLFFSVCYV